MENWQKIGKGQWRKGTIRFSKHTEFQTDYCRDILQDKNNKNLKELKRKDGDQNEDIIRESAEDIIPALQEDISGINGYVLKSKSRNGRSGD